MNLKKLLLVSLSVFVIVAMLAGCVATPPPAAEEAAAPAEEAAAEAEDDVPAAEEVTLRWANIISGPNWEGWVPIVEAFEAEYPYITVSSESTAGSGAAIYPDMLKTSMAAGDPPDLYFMWGGSIAQPFIDAGQAMDLTPYYEEYGWYDKYAPWVIERIASDGVQYGVPYRALGMGLWYRTDIFEEYGIEVPTTFAEQEEVCATLKENDIYCVTMGGKFGWHTMRLLDYFIEHHCGPELHNELNALQADWNQQCVIDSYNTFQKWIDNGWVVPDFLNVEPNDSRIPMIQGEAASILEGPWLEGVLKDFEQDLSMYDFYLPPTDHEPLRFSAFPEQWMIPQDAAHPDEAALFINFITDPEVQLEYMHSDFVNSATIGVNPDCEDWPMTCKWRDIILATEDAYPPTDQAFEKELMDGFFEVQDAIVAKRLTPEEGAELFQQRVEEWQATQ